MQGNGVDRSLNAGEVLINLNDEDIVLRPNIQAARVISRHFEGYAKARQALVNEDFDAVVFVIRYGSGMNDKMARTLEERVWKNGLTVELVVPLIKYIAVLNNGGRPLPTDIEGTFEVMSDSRNSGFSIEIEDHSSGNG